MFQRFLFRILVFSLCFTPWLRVTFVSAADFLPATSNDTFLNREWHLDAIEARLGWNVTTGTQEVIVAVIDGGIDITHEDLRENLWTNHGEIPGNNKDDDANGFVDDVHGWNFVNGSPDVLPTITATSPEEAGIHGTAVASVIAARGNNDIGISGIAWRARLMPLVVLDQFGYGSDEQLVRAIRYALSHGADIINLSLFGYDYDHTLAEAVREATSQGVLVVSAAGNGDQEDGLNLDRAPGYPACDVGGALPGKLTVTAVTIARKKAPKANYGSCVNISAPGDRLFAARPSRAIRGRPSALAGYIGGLTGTSIAAPVVSGLAALLKALHPDWRGPELARRILETTESIEVHNPKFSGALGSGMINARRALVSDQKTKQYGPLTLEGSAPGFSPEIRVLTKDGQELYRFAVGESGDRRGVRASFIRWQGKFEPDIVVSMLGDPTGAWRLYRPDGLLVAAGSVGAVSGGLTLAAQDLDYSGKDSLFLGEALGRRGWIVSPASGRAVEFYPFATGTVHGIAAASFSRPVPLLIVASIGGDAMVSAIGRNGASLDVGRRIQGNASTRWTFKHGRTPGKPDVFLLEAKKQRLIYEADATGLGEKFSFPAVGSWVQLPNGERQHDGWLTYEIWPR